MTTDDTSPPSEMCRMLRGPGGERIVDIVPGGTELELQLRRVVGQAAHAIIPTSGVLEFVRHIQ